MIHLWYLGEADKRADSYLAAYASSRLTLFAGRTVLAHNRMLYPFHKWLLTELRRAPEQPPGLVELIEKVLAEPEPVRATALVDAVVGFAGVDISLHEAGTRFVELTELSWRSGQAAPEDL
jgi:hypothetical protein